jgi:hypothetical protein
MLIQHHYNYKTRCLPQTQQRRMPNPHITFSHQQHPQSTQGTFSQNIKNLFEGIFPPPKDTYPILAACAGDTISIADHHYSKFTSLLCLWIDSNNTNNLEEIADNFCQDGCEVGFLNPIFIQPTRSKLPITGWDKTEQRQRYAILLNVPGGGGNMEYIGNNDIKNLKEALQNPKNFGLKEEDILVIPKMQKREIQKVIEWAKNNIKNNEPVLVYIAGHGYQSGANGFKMQQGIKDSDIDQLMDALPSRDKVLILETCHAGRMIKEEKKFEDE